MGLRLNDSTDPFAWPIAAGMLAAAVIGGAFGYLVATDDAEPAPPTTTRPAVSRDPEPYQVTASLDGRATECMIHETVHEDGWLLRIDIIECERLTRT